MTTQHPVTLNNLTKHYDGFDLNVSMTLPSGTVTGLVGRNGSGKTTTLKAILGLIKPDEGEITVLGKNPREFTAHDKEDLGVMMTNLGLKGTITVTTVIAMLRAMYSSFDEEFFLRQCKEQHLPLKKKLQEFSTGMKAKLYVLIAISHNAKLLILDEPTAGLDVVSRTEMLDLLREFLAQDSDRSVLISSHISTDLEGLCDNICFISDGQIALCEDTDVILDQYGILKVSEADFESLDHSHILTTRRESYGYSCLTDERQYYIENYPSIVVENGSIDNVAIQILTGRKLS